MDTNNHNHEEALYKIAKKRIESIKGFYVHLLVYVFVNTVLILLNTDVIVYDGAAFESSSFATPILWGIGLFAHWLSVFGTNIFLGKNWEEKKIRKLMEKQKQQRDKWE